MRSAFRSRSIAARSASELSAAATSSSGRLGPGHVDPECADKRPVHEQIGVAADR